MDITDYKILQTLSDGNHHSGETLAELLHTSRAAVCKRITKLRSCLRTATNDYIDIISVVGKGYSLNNTYDYLCLDQICQALTLNNINFNFSPTIASTNNYLIDSKIASDVYSICIAEQQTAGRGRNTIAKRKTWYSPFGSNIYCSIAWHYHANQSSLLGLSLVAGIVVAEIIQDLGCKNVSLKWPNDILINNCKVAGVLTEIYGEPNGGCKLVLGFGINVHNGFSDKQLTLQQNNIDQPWTTIADHTQQMLSRNNIISLLINNFVKYYDLFIEHGLEYFTDKWQHFDLFKNSMVCITIANTQKHGKYLGIDQSGAIIVEIDGQKQIFHSGEISVRAVHDYIN